MAHFDDTLADFAARGTPPLPEGFQSASLRHNGATLRYHHRGGTSLDNPVILLHGGLGHSGNFFYQVPALVASGYQPVLLDTRGHGRSSRDGQPYSYRLLAADVEALLDHLQIGRAPVIGWSDGACTALVLAAQQPSRVESIFFFGCNVDPTGTKPFAMTSTIANCLHRHRLDYAALSPAPDQFDVLMADLGPMQSSQPNYQADDLKRIQTPVTVAQAEHDEFISPDHAGYLARTLPQATHIELPHVSHFAPLQRPELFNAEILKFLRRGR